MLSKGAFDAAILTTDTVLKSSPGIDRARAIRGIALNKAKRYEEARKDLELALASAQPFPERKHVPHFLGWCCFHLGALEDSRKAFERHLELVPDEPDSSFGLALVALQEDRLDEADAAFAKALAGFSKEPAKPIDQARVLTRMADLALRRDDVAGAESCLDRAVKASPMLHETWSKVARVKDRLGKPAEADAARGNAQRILEAMGRTAPTVPEAAGNGASSDAPPADAPPAPESSPQSERGPQ